MEPASTIVEALGGPSKVAVIAGVHRTRVSNWMRERAKGGTGGVIPHWHVGKLLAHAEAEGIKAITAASFAPIVVQPAPVLTDTARP